MKYTGTILDGGLGSKDRRAALVAAMREAVNATHGNSDEGKALAAILADAEQRLAERLSRKAERKAAAEGDAPSAPRKVESDGTDASDAPSKPRKARKARKASNGRSSDAGKVAQKQCVACLRPFRTGGTDHGDDGWTCGPCDEEATE